jgi:hypothetical protein
MKLLPLLLSMLCLTGIIACKKPSENTRPSISFIALTPDTIQGGSNKDTTFLYFGIKDADGDLGNDPATGKYDIFLRDSRYKHDTSFPIGRYFLPYIPEDARDPINGVDGQGVIALRAVYITPRPDTLHKLHGDTLNYQVWVKDLAGNTSDTIETTPLYIR